ncbi:MAG TPA: class I SAM-dependent methyltransferase [Vicinamibacteria bacterium]|nr:class I SAM-dependent methyltransferase [Vicinamibacteria bacterium]
MSESTRGLGSVQKTLLLPLWGRAVETRRRRPLLVDRAAVEIVGKLDYDFSTMATRLHPVTRLAWIARALHVDRTVQGFLARNPEATVVNVGCGLDTTFERVDNGRLTWVDLDLPDVIQLRRRLVTESERRRMVAGSVFDAGWPRQLETAHGLMLVAAGVLYYFEEGRVRELLPRLAGSFPGGEMVFDTSSRRGVRIANERVIRDGGMDESAVLKWGIDRPRDVARWDRRIEVLEAHRLFRGITRRLPWRARLATLLSDALNIMSIAHLRFRFDEAR